MPEVERAVDDCKRAGALGARIMGGGFGGSVLALFGPGAQPPQGAFSVHPGPPAAAAVAGRLLGLVDQHGGRLPRAQLAINRTRGCAPGPRQARW